MPETCKAKYQFTVEEMVNSMTAHHNLGFRKSVRWLATGFFSLFLLFLFIVMAIMFFDGREYTRIFPTFVFLVIISAIILAVINLQRFMWTYKFNSRPDANMTIEWEFGEDEINGKTDLGESTTKWKGLLKIVEVKDGFLFYPVKNIFYWVPFDAFEKPECIDTVREFITKNKCQFIQQK